jgi:hypothetical protein
MTDAEVRAVYADARFNAAAQARQVALDEYTAADLECRRAWGALGATTAKRLTRALRAELQRQRDKTRP